MTPLELAANVFNLASVHLARRNRAHTWWTGLVGVSLCGVLFFGETRVSSVTEALGALVPGVSGSR